MLAGVVEPSSGEIRVNGERLEHKDYATRCKLIRMIFQDPNTSLNPRHSLDTTSLLELQRWDEATFLKRTEGSAIRRTGYHGWQRNIAVALGNSQGGEAVLSALQTMADGGNALVREHALWALAHLQKETTANSTPILHHPRADKLPD